MLTNKQMDEIIRLVEEHMHDCQTSQDFRQASLVKQKVLQMKSIRDLLEKEEILAQSKELEGKIVDDFHAAMEAARLEFEGMLERFHEQKIVTLEQVRQNQRLEYSKLGVYRKQPNPQFLNMQRIMGYLSNQKEFKKAEQYQIYLKELDEEQMRKSQAEYKMSCEQQKRNLRHKHAQYEEALILKFKDQEAKLQADFQRLSMEIEQRKMNQLKQLHQERQQRLQELERSRTKSLKVQIQHQLQELESCQYK